MASRKPSKGASLIKGPPEPFAGSRQPDGLTAISRQKLEEEGYMERQREVSTPTIVADDAPTSNVIELAPEAPAEERPRTPRPRTTRARPPSSKAAAKPAAPRVDKRTRAKYRLPNGRDPATTTRSHHFRLPAEIEVLLRELAAAHGCTQTHVVCSAIMDMAERSRRRRTRDAAGVADDPQPTEGGEAPG